MRQEDLPKANATCVLCGSPYYRCKRCIELRDRGIYGWKLYCDGTQCYQMKITLDDFINKKTSKEETRSALESIVFYPERPSPISPYKEAYEEVYKEDIIDNSEDTIEEPVVEIDLTVNVRDEEGFVEEKEAETVLPPRSYVDKKNYKTAKYQKQSKKN